MDVISVLWVYSVISSRTGLLASGVSILLSWTRFCCLQTDSLLSCPGLASHSDRMNPEVFAVLSISKQTEPFLWIFEDSTGMMMSACGLSINMTHLSVNAKCKNAFVLRINNLNIVNLKISLISIILSEIFKSKAGGIIIIFATQNSSFTFLLSRLYDFLPFLR